MSYYDSTVASYDNQIYNNNQRIAECNQKIKQLEDDIEELRRVKVKVANVDSAMTTATDNTSKKISNLPSLIVIPFSVMKTSFFSDFFDLIKGSEHGKAKKGIESASTKINKKISELQGEVETLRTEISKCNSNVSSLARQKSSYISAATTLKENTVSNSSGSSSKDSKKK